METRNAEAGEGRSMQSYQNLIAGFTKIDPRWVEASMRLRYGTLDHLSVEDFRQEAAIAELMLDEAGPEVMEELAWSYAL